MYNNEILITEITQSSTAVVLIPNRQITQSNLSDLGQYKIRLTCGLKASAPLPVYIQTSAGNIPIFNKYGNTIYTNQIKTRKLYSIGYGNGNASYTNGQFVIFDCICSGTIMVSQTIQETKSK